MSSSHERADNIEFNNVTYQRCQFAYEFAYPLIEGKKVLDVGCGLAYGTALMAGKAAQITGLDYDQETVNANKEKYKDIPNLDFIRRTVPPIDVEENSYDVVTSFQFIEHIHNRDKFIENVYKVLKPGGTLLLTTPNNKRTLAPNPFHVHEYTFAEMQKEIGRVFKDFELMGLDGNEKVNKYYEENSKWVRKILKWDILGLHKILPPKILFLPYNIVTNMMRKKLMKEVKETIDVSTDDFLLSKENLDAKWDIYVIARKEK
jgi:2-polyprenyl-3-methyl-5-hydroxy-6-metoxy-1,4-benzoquinol methylase